jgi:uncharacterized YccA/Bax inhibitor family protein
MSKSFFESKNPVLNEEKLKSMMSQDDLVGVPYEKMTISGAINKTLVLFAILLATSAISFMMPTTFLLIIGVVGSLIAVLVASFKPHTSPIAAPVYAGFEGLALGSISAFYAAQFDGIIMQAVSLTFGTLLSMLMLYKSGLITVNEKFRAGVMMATGAIALVYLVSFVGSFFGWNMPYLHEGGAIGIGISVVIIAVAAMNLLLDFDNFDKAEQAQAPKYMEWFCGLSLMVTLVWLYLEFLRLLSKLNRE